MAVIEELFDVKGRKLGEAVVKFNGLSEAGEWAFPTTFQKNMEALICELGKDLGLHIPLGLLPDVFLVAGYMFAIGRLVERDNRDAMCEEVA